MLLEDDVFVQFCNIALTYQDASIKLFEEKGGRKYILIDLYNIYLNSKFGDYVECTYPIELEIKDTTDTVKSAYILTYI